MGHGPVVVISLAAGTIPELGPAEFVEVAAAAGWPAAGVWCDPDTWSDSTADAVRRRLDDSGVFPLDLEPVIVAAEGDAGDLQIDAAATIGAAHVLVVNLDLDAGAFAERFAQLCDRARPLEIVCALEFLPIMATRSLAQALEIISAVDRPNAALLVDNLHLDRSGGSPDDVRSIDPRLLPYAQICDAPAAPAEDLVFDARMGRLNLGEGALPITEFIAALPPSTHLSAEIRSQRLYLDLPDPLERATAVLAATRRVEALR